MEVAYKYHGYKSMINLFSINFSNLFLKSPMLMAVTTTCGNKSYKLIFMPLNPSLLMQSGSIVYLAWRWEHAATRMGRYDAISWKDPARAFKALLTMLRPLCMWLRAFTGHLLGMNKKELFALLLIGCGIQFFTYSRLSVVGVHHKSYRSLVGQVIQSTMLDHVLLVCT